MRNFGPCTVYFLRQNSIQGVSFLNAASAARLVEEAVRLFQKHANQFDGFEVWHAGRLVHRFARSEHTSREKD